MHPVEIINNHGLHARNTIAHPGESKEEYLRLRCYTTPEVMNETDASYFITGEVVSARRCLSHSQVYVWQDLLANERISFLNLVNCIQS
jgi:hypothetical protein